MGTFGKIALTILVVLGLIFIALGLRACGVASGVVSQVTDPTNIITNYEDFQSMYNTCSKLNTDLGSIRALPKNDPMFSQFSKSAMITQKKQLLARWVEEYNAKSKMITRSMWKAGALPYQLSVDDFPNYNGGGL